MEVLLLLLTWNIKYVQLQPIKSLKILDMGISFTVKSCIFTKMTISGSFPVDNLENNGLIFCILLWILIRGKILWRMI